MLWVQSWAEHTSCWRILPLRLQPTGKWWDVYLYAPIFPSWALPKVRNCLQKQFVWRTAEPQHRKAGYSKKYHAEHESDILLHQAAKKYFDEINLEKIPSRKNLHSEFKELLLQKRSILSEYNKAQAKMRELQTRKSKCWSCLEYGCNETPQRNRKDTTLIPQKAIW